jgi:hypothetical protein
VSLFILSLSIQTFLKDFFEQNPLSHIGIIVSYDGKAEKLTELSGNPTSQMDLLKKKKESGGNFSLQASLDLACASLRFGMGTDLFVVCCLGGGLTVLFFCLPPSPVKFQPTVVVKCCV